MDCHIPRFFMSFASLIVKYKEARVHSCITTFKNVWTEMQGQIYVGSEPFIQNIQKQIKKKPTLIEIPKTQRKAEKEHSQILQKPTTSKRPPHTPTYQDIKSNR